MGGNFSIFTPLKIKEAKLNVNLKIFILTHLKVEKL